MTVIKLPTISSLPLGALESLTETSRAVVQRLHTYTPEPWPSDYASSKHASVLVLLYERDGIIRVLLTTRSKALRTHAGQTALPGGKVDDTDTDVVHTALREAHEEVGLPLDCPDLHLLCYLEPFVSLHKILVTPVVAVLLDLTVLDKLKASEHEVSRIFSHPLQAFLEPTLAASEKLVEKGTEDWIYETELHDTSDVKVQMLNGAMYRMHRFRSTGSPIKGLTSDIMIKVAQIGYNMATSYERYAPTQLLGYDAISVVVASTSAGGQLQ
ncbi:hypothetical protein PC9H_009621 [Pleurotus ostreatus]|uniref:Nudix hydrolase domain-containing protein n=2 Tax=Pleurotus TaxID=5320 RepID=A0A8H7DN43_PLEOS|nr:uncharacterized protein PC9H_009621 [Pleurotus ostreatus]KAF7424314.1 hypothetical protein PC9H_009621 [Pleurotus ostreatus]KAG9224768.1 hypothetical protein CCMSSC00406_0002081 [Pleurotus cornucopiae]KAJ8692781.1 hypothetical protein PTI98_010060 [Pleurotus ostreatus]